MKNKRGNVILVDSITRLNKYTSVGFFLFFICTISIVNSTYHQPASALEYQSNVNVSFNFNPTVTVTLGGDSGTDLVIDTLAPGGAADSNIVSVTASTNSSTGYYLYVTAGSSTSGNTYYDTNELKNGSNTFTSLTGTASTISDIAAGYWGYAYSAHDQNTWVSGNTGSTSSGYNGLPKSTSGNGITLLSTNGVDTTTIDFKIAAKATTAQTAGTYSNVVNFAIIVKPITTTYTISYNDATSSATSLPSVSESGTISSGNTANVTLSSTIPTRSGYNFKGWCTVTTTTDACTGNIYDAGSTYIVGNIGGTVTIPLYAMWKERLNMQDATFAQCGETMRDSRDDKEYTTALLADGKCWMTTNLNLAGGTALSANDTDVDSSYISSFSTSNNLTKTGNTLVLPASSTSGFNTENYSYVYNSGSTTCGNNSPCYSYYSWDAATLGSGRSISTYNTDAPYSICPKGWRLPTSRTTSATNWQTESDFYVLAHQYGLDSTTSTSESDDGFYTQAGPNTTPNFLLAGFYQSGSFYNGGRYGFYWSATTSDYGGSRVLNLHFGSSRVFSALDENSNYGFSVRCVMKTMQETTIADLSEGEEKTVIDARDGKDYTVKKINGQLWMTQNLRYLGDTGSAAGTMTIGNSNSNVADKSITLYSLDSSNAGSFNDFSGHCDYPDSYNYACVYDSGSTSTGVWYNYYAASAGTISTDSNDTAATSDICPAGWHLPSGPNTTADTDFNKLVGNTTSGWQDATSGLTAFSAVAGGYYGNGSFSNAGNGLWWSATARSTTSRSTLRYDSSNGQFYGGNAGLRYSGFFVRCVRSS